jgi:peptide-methionine (R)-S-oxide reductase
MEPHMNRRYRFVFLAVVILLTAGAAVAVLGYGSPREERTALKIGHPKDGRVEKTEDEWRALLGKDTYRITRQRGTELACSAPGWNSKAEGRYDCICCGQALFDSEAKYESGTGWPSFFQPVDEEVLSLYLDRSPGLGTRIEVTCSRCDAHLGHVFDDGPAPTRKRYCMNMGAMKFVAK